MKIIDWTAHLPWNEGERWKTRLTPWKDNPGAGIVLHQTGGAYKRETNQDLISINAYHTSKENHITPGRGLPHIAYHFVMDDDGQCYQCNALDQITWHCKGYNENSIGVALLGDFDAAEAHYKGRDTHPTAEQLAALPELIAALRSLNPVAWVQGHCERRPSKPSCPGVAVMEWLTRLRAR